MIRVAVPNLGNYTIALAASVESLGTRPWCSVTTPEIMKLGCEAAPESACVPFKASLGHFIKAADDGVRYGVIVNSIGTCRLKYYRTLQQQIIDAQKRDIYIFGLGYDGFKPPLIRHFDPGLPTFIKGVVRAAWKMQVVDAIEQQAWKTRPCENRTGDTSRLMADCLHELESIRRVREIKKLAESVPDRFAAIPVTTRERPLRVALIGEASVLRDRYLNHNIEDILGRLGVVMFNFFLLGAELKKIFKLDFRNKHNLKNQKKLAYPYLKSIVGGHAIDSIANTIRCANDGYDGVIHMCPSGCMPEVSIRPILRQVSRDYNIPVLEFSFDEHTSHVGIITRVEAFVDILHSNRVRRKKELNVFKIDKTVE